MTKTQAKELGLDPVGYIGVDSALVWIGDPSYILHLKPEDTPKSLGKTWQDFTTALITEKHPKQYPISHSFNYDLGHEGLGVCVTSGLGDGKYPVYAKVEDLGYLGIRITQLTVDFFPEHEDEH